MAHPQALAIPLGHRGGDRDRRVSHLAHAFLSHSPARPGPTTCHRGRSALSIKKNFLVPRIPPSRPSSVAQRAFSSSNRVQTSCSLAQGWVAGASSGRAYTNFLEAHHGTDRRGPCIHLLIAILWFNKPTTDITQPCPALSPRHLVRCYRSPEPSR